MDSEVKQLGVLVVEKICRKIRRTMKNQFYQMGVTVDIGADGTPTSFIDRMAEEVAVKVLKGASVSVDLLSEECGFCDLGGEYVFVLDPIDGTRNAYHGIPFFSVSLGIGHKVLSDVEFGIVKNIATGDEFIAERGVGAFWNKQQIGVCEVPPVERMYSVLLGRHATRSAVKVAQEQNVRSLGSAALEMCLVGMGALDLYYVDKKFMRVVDIAAATLVVREAGGVVWDRFGNELEMELSLDDRTSVIAAGSKEVAGTVVQK